MTRRGPKPRTANGKPKAPYKTAPSYRFDRRAPSDAECCGVVGLGDSRVAESIAESGIGT